ncbi:putative ABC transport system permease protein [Mucilaginibacter mallensis]|uniref:Putative ABC transport system permease protein n=1 Tax=Mucilaginibacter mallensis TaxID=652787 RepID=A0A1H1Z6Z7_MUCMA|nr:ABC transporter permease [Mucilaginibacter mallensis]SDT29605.1 putative ABC transport system permease protein [Mucilaginibacter mallensis]
MIKNYFKIAWRSLWKHKAYSFINIVGLSIGLTACLIVATVVFDELSYDHQWKKANDIYRVISISNNVNSEQPMPVSFAGLGPVLKTNFPEVADYCRMSVSKERLQLGNLKQGVAFQQLIAESSVWNVLDFNIIKGNPQKYVKGYVNLVITKKIQQQYFAGQNPIGKLIYTQPEFGKPQPCLITGVIDHIPQNSHLRADFISIVEYRASDNHLPQKGEGYSFYPQYILLKPGTSATTFTAKVNQWYAKQPGAKDANYSFHFQPIKDVYLRSDFNGVQAVHGSIKNVYIFAGVAALLLVIACINFINLTISRVFNRSKETGIRKVLGAEKFQLIIRFLSESLIFFILSFALAILLYPLFIKPVETFLDHQLVLNLYNGSFLIIAIGCVFGVSFLTGLYPAWYLSRPKPIVILRNKLASDVQLNVLKKGLVIGQFVISVTIIMATIIVHNQLGYMNNKDLGFDKNNLLNISFTDWAESGAAFKQAVKKIPGVQNVSIANWAPTEGSGSMSREVSVPGQKGKIEVFFIEGDADLPATLGFKLKQGRMLNPALATDAMNSDSAMSGTSAATKAERLAWPLLATNYTASLLGMKVNKTVADIDGVPVGIIEDFNSESLHNKLKPTFIQAISDSKYGNMLVRIKPGYEKTALTGISAAYKSFYPEKTFDYNWSGDQIDNQYKAEFKLQRLFTCFSLLIIFLACLGLFGLVSFTAEQRVKEIGIRKVLGASVSNIITLISKDYLALVMISVVIASPIAWYAMNKWLQDFAYRISIQWWVFALTGILALLIAFATVSFQSVKAALANPVKSLRSE